METPKIPTRTKVQVAITDVKPNDVIFLSNKDDASAYLVLDTGNPFILIENMRTHFAYLYRPNYIYKEI